MTNPDIPPDPPNFISTGGGPDEFERALLAALGHNSAQRKRRTHNPTSELTLPPLEPTPEPSQPQPPMKDITPKDINMPIETARTMIAVINEMIKDMEKYNSSEQLSTAGTKLNASRECLIKFINS